MKFSAGDFFGLAEYRRTSAGKWALRPIWRRILIATAILCLVGYLALAGFLFLREHNLRKLESTGFSEMLVYPFSGDVRRKQHKLYSDALIESAKQSDDPYKTLNLVRQGLTQDASQPDGRIFYSYVLFLQRRSRDALEFLLEGLDNERALAHPEYIRFFTRQCVAHFEDELLIEAANTFAGHEKISPKNRFALCAGAAQAEIALGKFSEAERRLNTEPLAGTTSAVFLSARIARERGDVRKSAGILLELREQFKSPELDIIVAEDLRELGKNETALRFVDSALRNTKDSPEFLTRMIDVVSKIDLESARKRKIELENVFWERYGNDVNALEQFAMFAAERREEETVERCFRKADDSAFINLPEFILIHLETLLRSGNAVRAKAELDEIFREKPGWFSDKEPILCGIRAAALYACGEDSLGEIFLQTAQNSAQLTVPQTIALARTLEENGNAMVALRFLESRQQIEPAHPTLLCAILDLAVRQKDSVTFACHAPKLKKSRRPPYKALLRFLKFSESDHFVFYEKQAELVEFFERSL